MMQMPLSEETLNPPLMEIELAEGDILYLPSGTPHSAVAEDETSLHVGIGIDPPKIADVLAAYIKMLAEKKIRCERIFSPFGLSTAGKNHDTSH